MVGDILLLELLGKLCLQQLERVDFTSLVLHIFLQSKQLLLALDCLLDQTDHILGAARDFCEDCLKWNFLRKLFGLHLIPVN